MSISDDEKQVLSNLFMTILTACDMCCGQNSCFWGWLMIYGKYGFCCCILLRKCFTNSRTIVNSCIVADNKGVVVSIIILPLDLNRCWGRVDNKYVDKRFSLFSERIVEYKMYHFWTLLTVGNRFCLPLKCYHCFSLSSWAISSLSMRIKMFFW